MAADSTLQALVFVLISFSLADVSSAWCNRYYLSDCNTGQVCCNNQCVYGSDCIGQSCSTSGDCNVGESCCNSLCKDGSCYIGESCSTSGDCSVGVSCCDGTCQDGYDCDYDPTDPTAVIVGITFWFASRRLHVCNVYLLRCPATASSAWESHSGTKDNSHHRYNHKTSPTGYPPLHRSDATILPTRLPILPPTSI